METKGLINSQAGYLQALKEQKEATLKQLRAAANLVKVLRQFDIPLSDNRKIQGIKILKEQFNLELGEASQIWNIAADLAA